MSWVTFIWALVIGACVIMALPNLLVGLRSRAWENLFFVLAALSVAGIAAGELTIMHARTVEEIGRAQRWAHLPVFTLLVAIVGFVYFYFGTGRLWLALTACLARFASLVINFAAPPNLNFREITGVRLFDFLGDTVAAPEGVISGWTRLGELSSLLLLIFVIDASVTLWRQGSSENRRRAAVVGGSITVFIVLAAGLTALIHLRLLHTPYLISLPFLGVVLAMGFELSYDILRASQTARQLRASEAALRESDTRMNLAASAANLALWVWDVEKDDIWITEKGRELFGFAKPGPIDLTQFLSVVHEDDRARMQQQIQDALARGNEYESEYRITAADGKTRWVAGYGRVELDEQGKPGCMRGVSRDITKRKMAEEALRESEAELLEGRAGLQDQLRFERLATDISNTLMRVPAEELRQQIQPALGKMAQFLGYDVATLSIFTGDGAGQMPYIWHEANTPGLPADLTDKDFPWLARELFAGRVCQIQTLNDFPPEAQTDRATYERYGLKSSLDVPVFVSGQPVGVLSMGSFRRELSVSPQLVERQRALGNVFGNALVRARSEIAVSESEARFRTVADTAPVMIWMSNTDKQGVFFNKGWLEFTGRSLDQELGAGWLEGIHSEDLANTIHVCGTHVLNREPFTVEYRLRHKDGEYRWLLDTGTPRFEPDGTFLGYIGSCIDITERRQAELDHQLQSTELARVGRLAVMGELAASLAHEVNNPLGAMVTNASAGQRLLSHGQLRPEELRELLADIVSDGQRARQVIESIRNMVRKSESSHSLVDITDIVRDLLRIVRADAIARKVSLVAEVDPNAGVVMADRVQLLQVLLNLTMNAFEALSVIRAEARRVVIRADRVQDGKICVSVRDAGPGFPDGLADQLFEPFFSTKTEGTGMGLAIARSIIEAHGGTLSAKNCADGGALFTICLPEATEAKSRAA